MPATNKTWTFSFVYTFLNTFLQTRRTLINAAYSPPSIEPVLNLNHHDYLLKEMRWLAVDVAQVRNSPW